MTDVTLPDGTVIRASSIVDRREHDPTRSFGLYMDHQWRPSWPAEMIDWPDFGLPVDPDKAAGQIEAAYARARQGELVEVGCVGGIGRTGTVLRLHGRSRRHAGIRGRRLGARDVSPGSGRDDGAGRLGEVVRSPPHGMTTLGLVTGASVIEVVRELERGDLVVWLDGGWGIDALLGRETRTHSDLDLVIDRHQVPRAQQLLCGLGFEDEPDAQFGVALRDQRRGRVDFHLVEFDTDGNGRGEHTWSAYPASGLTGAGVVAGEAVRCVTAELRVRRHLEFEWDGQDQQDLRLLAAQFGIALVPTVRNLR